MKLSKTGWNNVIIFSVMIMILLINVTSKKLFTDESANQADSSQQSILADHSVILTLAINNQLMFQRSGVNWQIIDIASGKEVALKLTNQQIEQVMLAWQQSTGLVQADDIIIEGQKGIAVTVGIAGKAQAEQFTLYPLIDQLLLYKHSSKQNQQGVWLALPQALTAQLLPCCLNG